VIDPDSPMTIITAMGAQRTNPVPTPLAPLPPAGVWGLPNPNSTYDPSASTTDVGRDTLRFRAGSMQSVGYYMNDNICTIPTGLYAVKTCMQ
jgi:hypothetical protein